MGIFAGGKAARASGGISTTTVGPYTVHAFTTTGANTFAPTTTGFVDILLVGAGGWGGSTPPGSGSGGGGAGATLLRKFVPLTTGTPYPVVVGSATVPGSPVVSGVANSTTFTYSGTTLTAYGGGSGGPDSSPGDGASSPNASGGGCGKNGSTFGAGASVYGIGYPGGNRATPSSGEPGGGGGGAGGAGVPGQPGPANRGAGGPGVPIAYFTGNPADIVSRGGDGSPAVTVNSTYGSGGRGASISSGPTTPLIGIQGVAYIRYI